ncbi:hypothetical protein Taro_024551 [Colocasia esculenta]|uniref:non-specific serine/threonine protein kinase n=1 Tax=Colocasia esculenta TaxID=4460 RepID=A0A843VHT8_COLES|nr:hypothetical protein [Colocasia esculenta]
MRASNSFVGTEEYIAPASLSVRQLMYRLLHRDPRNRLGSREGANDIKKHPFFLGVNWALIRCTKPPRLDAPVFGRSEAEAAQLADPAPVDSQIVDF